MLGELSREGHIIDVLDGIIGAIVLVNDCDTILTRGLDHFARIPDLSIETY